ncbi:MAG: hypothetical protein EA422_15410 [Gemmatimonadales bacterium]|nr:MAG: hypothetical protein EA422_15410 [Gemmatimonadales bacterium]
MVGLLAHSIWSQYQVRVAQAEGGVLSLAEAHAVHLERTLLNVDALLGELARDPWWQTSDEASCHTHLRSFRNAVPTVGEVSGFGPAAELLCTSWGVLGDRRTEPVPDRLAFVQSVIESGEILFGSPAPGGLTDRMGVTVGVPIPGATPDAPPRGAAVAMLELERLQELLTPRSLPEGAVVTVGRALDGVVVARSEDWEDWVGRPILWGPVSGNDLLEGAGLSRTHGGDEVDRLWGFAPIPGAEWVVFVGVPESEVYGPIRSSAIRSGGLAGGLILLVGILAGLFHRSLGAVVRGFTTDARAAAENSSRRIELRGPKELDLLAQEFNRTLEARAQAERELVRAERKLQGARRMEVVGDLAAGVAHEFNNILTVIRMENALVQEDLAHAGLEIDGSAQVERASERAAGLVSQLLALGRRDPSSPRSLCPSTELRSRLPRYRGEFGDRLNIHLDADPASPNIYMDPRHLDQIVRNLLRNAWDAMPHGGMVTIAVSPGSGIPQPVLPGGNGPSEVGGSPTCVIRVSDTGPGMTQDVRRRAFDPFFTTRPHGQRVGLGLSTVYGIATRSGAQVNLESRPGAGTTVEVILPGTDDPPQ